ncbi:MAG: hypothetical protein LBV74_01010 [Tannerella sp.]|jgi:hypothetical protein|nr:hypothetical protein [Tannerella sp.]
MEKDGKIDYAKRVFAFLVKQTANPVFVFPGGGAVQKTVSACMDSLEYHLSCELSPERITDYCICQACAVHSFGKDYLRKWNVSHSFGQKAIQRFLDSNSKKKYFEDVWLRKNRLSRTAILEIFQDRRLHPLARFIFPEYEETTKKRLLNTEAGFCICILSTLLWTPFSGACNACLHYTNH